MKRGYSVVALEHPKTPLNVGSVLRLAVNYDVALVVSSGTRYRHSATDTPKGSRHRPFFEGVDDIFEFIPYNCVPVAVDIIPGATPLPQFCHPERAFYVFGPEDGTLTARITERCEHTVYVPTTRCMNLAATVGVVLYDRMAKGLQ